MSWVLSSTTACTKTLDAKAARAAEVVGPGVVELSITLLQSGLKDRDASNERAAGTVPGEHQA